MQALSSMRRNSNDIYSLKFATFCGFLIAYQAISVAFQFVPTLIGLFFCYLVIATYERDKNLQKYDSKDYLAFAYLVFCEQNYGFFLFSSLIAFLLFYNFAQDYLRVNIKCRACILIIFVASGYLSTFGISNLMSYISNSEFLKISYEYLYYIILESLMAIILFRWRVV